MSGDNSEIFRNKLLVLLDGNALMHRAYHGMNRGFVPQYNGMPVGMVYGIALTLMNAIQVLNPDVLVVTFDTKEKTFRHKLDENYKANRKKAPDDFYPQLPLVEELFTSFNVPILKKPGFESDDLIGTLATNAPQDFLVKIVSGDLDFTQLVTERISLIKLAGKIEHSPEYGPAETLARYEVTPAQMIDLKAIMGDSSDNYKGVAGVGPKTAAKLIQQFGSLDHLYQQIDQIEKESLRQKFLAEKKYVYHCQSLAKIATDVEIDFDFSQKYSLENSSAEEFLTRLNFKTLASRFAKISSGSFSVDKKVDNSKNEEQMTLF
ncbi:hypothetical protein CSB37_03995 [bacterium DOLZORAL124_38_8]|nr:MAG: hypothetical protein CSB37_03995 [bacterium DOLZORAL124_38_8]